MDSVSGVGVIDKGVLILRALVVGPLDLAGLQDATGMPRATAHRLAVALEQHHLVRRDALGRFCLGFELIRLGHAASEQFPLAEVADPILRDAAPATVPASPSDEAASEPPPWHWIPLGTTVSLVGFGLLAQGAAALSVRLLGRVYPMGATAALKR